MLWLNFKHCIIMCTLTKFCHLKIFVKKTAAVSKCQQFIIHLLNFEQHLQLNLWKDLPFFYIFWNFDFVFTSLQNFMISKIEKKKKKKCGLLFEQYFRQKWSKILRFLWRIFQVRFTFYTVTQVYYDCISTRITAVSMMLTKCYLFQRAYSLPPVFQIFFDLPYTFLDIYNFH